MVDLQDDQKTFTFFKGQKVTSRCLLKTVKTVGA